MRVEGTSWATDILAKAQDIALEPVTTPPGFKGELRSYQAEALAWLGFLDTVGLGGCLALDMGLGKTPTVLARVAESRGDGPTLVIAPPAVVGNWAAEAERFTPGLKVVVHHGASRASTKELEKESGFVAPAIEAVDEEAAAIGQAERSAASEPEDVLESELDEEARRRSSEPLGGE